MGLIQHRPVLAQCLEYGLHSIEFMRGKEWGREEREGKPPQGEVGAASCHRRAREMVQRLLKRTRKVDQGSSLQALVRGLQASPLPPKDNIWLAKPTRGFSALPECCGEERMRLAGWRTGCHGRGLGWTTGTGDTNQEAEQGRTGKALGTAGKDAFIDLCRIPCGWAQAVGNGHRAGRAGR